MDLLSIGNTSDDQDFDRQCLSIESQASAAKRDESASETECPGCRYKRVTFWHWTGDQVARVGSALQWLGCDLERRSPADVVDTASAPPGTSSP